MSDYKHGDWYCKPANKEQALEIIKRAIASGAENKHGWLGDSENGEYGVIDGRVTSKYIGKFANCIEYTIEQLREKFPIHDETKTAANVDNKMKASEFLQCGIDHMKDREKTYDAEDGERSMNKTVTMFNTLYGKTITEEEGWAFMCLLKLVRTSQGNYRSDNYEDLAAYAGLMGESAQERNK